MESGSPQSVKLCMGEAIHKVKLKKAGVRYWGKPVSAGEGLGTSRAGKPGERTTIDVCVFAY